MAASAARDIAKYFVRQDVQTILKGLTGFDLSKIYKATFNRELLTSKMELLSNEQLEKEKEKAVQKAQELLQFPPVMKPRQPCEQTLVEDERLNPLNLTKTNYVFTDISLNVPHKKRMVVVREHNGRLRTASHEEREKMIQIYFPQPGKPLNMPAMFEPANLEECLKLKNYLIVLKKACVRFEPDDPEFLRVTNRVYEYVNEVQDYEMLHSTRFFGPMTFYLAWNKKIENLVEWYLNRSDLKSCIELLRLYSILNAPEQLKNLNPSETSQRENLSLIQKSVTKLLPSNVKITRALEGAKEKCKN